MNAASATPAVKRLHRRSPKAVKIPPAAPATTTTVTTPAIFVSTTSQPVPSSSIIPAITGSSGPASSTPSSSTGGFGLDSSSSSSSNNESGATSPSVGSVFSSADSRPGSGKSNPSPAVSSTSTTGPPTTTTTTTNSDSADSTTIATKNVNSDGSSGRGGGDSGASPSGFVGISASTPQSSPTFSSGLGTGAIAGITAVIIILFVLLVAIVLRRKRSSRDRIQPSSPNTKKAVSEVICATKPFGNYSGSNDTTSTSTGVVLIAADIEKNVKQTSANVRVSRQSPSCAAAQTQNNNNTIVPWERLNSIICKEGISSGASLSASATGSGSSTNGSFLRQSSVSSQHLVMKRSASPEELTRDSSTSAAIRSTGSSSAQTGGGSSVGQLRSSSPKSILRRQNQLYCVNAGSLSPVDTESINSIPIIQDSSATIVFNVPPPPKLTANVTSTSIGSAFGGGKSILVRPSSASSFSTADIN